MEEIKSKFLDLINIQGQPKIPIVGSLSLDISCDEDCQEEESKVKPCSEAEKLSDSEILETIDNSFFNTDESFDAGHYELSKQIFTDSSVIQSVLKQLKRQHFVVSNHVLQMILEKQSSCQEEFNRIVEIQEQVNSLLKGVDKGRSNLKIATKHFTTASLGILASYRKRTLIKQLLRSLDTIKTLHETESRIPELLNSGDFSEAISLLLECREIAVLHKQFSCVSGLNGKLQDTLVMTEEQLDVALAKICYRFDETIYKKLQLAYALLEKTQMAMDQLHMHFTSAVHRTASNVVNCFIGENTLGTAIEFSQFYHLNIHDGNYINKIDFPELCKGISEENFIPCLLLLCKSLWCIILSYNQVVLWHQSNFVNNTGSHFETCYNEQTVKQKLTSGLNRIWHDIQMRVSALVLSGNLSNYKFDDFLQILAILHRFSQIGDELCGGSGSEEVANSIKTQSSKYFKAYHAAKLDDLKVFLENEAWTLCPVRSDFSILHLQEFRGLRCSLEQCAGTSSKQNTSFDSSSVDGNFFNRYPDPLKGTPFDINFQMDSHNEEILASIGDDPSGYFSEETDEESDLHSTLPVSEKARERGPRKEAADGGPLVTNTTVSVLRLCGKYLQMSKYLKPIASEVVSALTQLFDFYLYTVHSFFASNMPNTLSLNVSSLKLQAVLNRIRDTLIIQNDDEEQDLMVYEVQVSPLVDLTSPNTLFGLVERVVGVESLLFLSREFLYLRSYLEQLLQSQGSPLHSLQHFYSQAVAVSFEVRKPVYACVAWRAINDKHVLELMSKVDWEVEDVMCEHSGYIDYLIGEIQQFAKRLDNLKNIIAIPVEAYNILWDNLIFLLANLFVEGFSSAKKCSTGGRALMHLDFIQLVSKLDKICTLRPIPYRDFVEGYIKAYYQPVENLESWIMDHKEYTSKQLLALVFCVCQNNKKSRQKLSNMIDELEKCGIR